MTASPPSPPTPDRVAEIAPDLTERDALRALLRRAWRELNAIRAETGAPLGYDGMTRCTYQHWHDLVEDCHAALGDDALPWETPAAKALTDRAEKAAEARSADLVAALGEVTQAQAATIARLTAEAAAVRAAALAGEGPVDITDEMVEAGAEAFIAFPGDIKESMRDALAVALAVAQSRSLTEEALQRAIAAFEAAHRRKTDDMLSVSPTEHPDDGGGPIGYGITTAIANTFRVLGMAAEWFDEREGVNSAETLRKAIIALRAFPTAALARPAAVTEAATPARVEAACRAYHTTAWPSEVSFNDPDETSWRNHERSRMERALAAGATP